MKDKTTKGDIGAVSEWALVLRVAREIAQVPLKEWQGISQVERQVYVEAARRALSAIREAEKRKDAPSKHKDAPSKHKRAPTKQGTERTEVTGVNDKAR